MVAIGDWDSMNNTGSSYVRYITDQREREPFIQGL
jgi:hypothetical protein